MRWSLVELLEQMLENAGRDRASIGIRSTAGDPATRVVDKGQQIEEHSRSGIRSRIDEAPPDQNEGTRKAFPSGLGALSTLGAKSRLAQDLRQG